MTFPLRLTEDLHREARERAARVGISLNALISVALDAYLRAPQAQNASQASADPSPVLGAENVPEAVSGHPVKVFKGQPQHELWEWIQRQDNGVRVPKHLRQVVHQYRQHLGL